MAGIPALAQAPTTNGGILRLADQFVGPQSPKSAPSEVLPSIVAQSYVLPIYVSTGQNNASNTGVPVRWNPPVARPEIISYIKEIFGEASQKAIAVFTCESGLNPDAVNWNDAKITGKPSMGIAQLNRPYDVKYFDWRFNIDTAYREFYVPRGWQPWTCAKNLGIR